MQTIEDMRRLQKVVDTSSDFGVKIKLVLKRLFYYIMSKLALILGGIILGVVFFLIGLLFSKKES